MQRLGPQQLQVQSLVGSRSPRDRRVEAAIGDAPDLDVAGQHPFVDANVGLDRRDELVRQPAHIPTRNGAVVPAIRRCAPAASASISRASAKQLAPRGGQRDVPPVALEQLRAHAVLEGLDLLRKRRRRDVQALTAESGSLELRHQAHGAPVLVADERQVTWPVPSGRPRWGTQASGQITARRSPTARAERAISARWGSWHGHPRGGARLHVQARRARESASPGARGREGRHEARGRHRPRVRRRPSQAVLRTPGLEAGR